MRRWFETDWEGIFVPEMSLPEVLLRSALVYFSVILLLRVVLRRQAGKLSLSDLLVVALIAGVCRNPLVRDTKSIPDGMLMVAMILFWNFAVDWLSYHVPAVRKLLQTPPVQLIDRSRVLAKNLARELMTEEQLLSKLRQKGVKEPGQVAGAWMEGGGEISVVLDPGRVPVAHNGAARKREGRKRT